MHTVHDDFQVQLAHAGDDGLTSFLIGVGLEGRVFFSQTQQRHGELFLTSLGLGLDGNADNGFREDHGLQHNGMILIAEGITGGGVLQADGRRNIARVDLFDLFAVIGVHLKDAAEALALALGGVENVGAGFTGTGVHAEERQLTDEGIRHDLEGQRRRRALHPKRDGWSPHPCRAPYP